MVASGGCGRRLSRAATARADRPATVYIRLENRTDRDLDLRIVPELFPRNYQVGTYFSLADIVHNKTLEQIRKGQGDDIVTVNIHLGKTVSLNFGSTRLILGGRTKWHRTCVGRLFL